MGQDIFWHKENYNTLLAQGGSDAQRIEALEALLGEQYIEIYMAEYTALCFRAGKEDLGRRMARKQLRLFAGEPWDIPVHQLLDGEIQADVLLGDIAQQRAPAKASAPQQTTPAARTEAPMIKEEAPSSSPLPEPVENCFRGIVGMGRAKAVLRDFYTSVQIQTARSGYDLKVQSHCHFIIRGESGMGKSLLAGRIAALLQNMGAASTEKPNVVAGYRLPELLGSDGSGLSDALKDLGGQTVLIDGIEPLFPAKDGGNLPFLFRVVLERYSDQMNFILAASGRDIDRLLGLEPSLSGKFLYDITLSPYTSEELVEIAAAIAREKGYTLSTAAREQLRQQMETNRKDPVFEWGRTLDGIINRATLRHADRVSRNATVSKGNLMRIEPQDLEFAAKGPSVDELLKNLDSLTGLAAVKTQVRELVAMAAVNQEALKHGQAPIGFGSLHMVFRGSAGTGKTTVARIIGEIYKALGILPRGDKVVECTRADLVAQYSGQTAPKVKAKVQEALGGVLFIDEAYDLCRDNDSFGQEALNTLVSEIENNRDHFMVILAGYPGDMDELLDKNEGLRSRFPNVLDFENYTQSEMEDIFLGMLQKNGRRLDKGCQELIGSYISENRGKRGFGNARGVRNLFERLTKAQSQRLNHLMQEKGSLEDEDFILIKQEDVTSLLQSTQETETLEDLLAQLDSLTGLKSVKAQVREMVDATRAQQLLQTMGLKDAEDHGTLHMLFLGNAGTGKTTVARIISRIYNKLGLLPSGDIFVECGRSDLVANYVGQTATKTKEIVKRALGGVLFIDEAYALCEDPDNDSFGREAVETLLAEMENHRSELMVILAGYSENMARFFAVNQGLESRVPTKLVFEDYTQEELELIFKGMVRSKGFRLSPEAVTAAGKWIADASRATNFGNARGVRNIMDRVVRAHKSRLGRLISSGTQPGEEDSLTITAEDVEAAIPPQEQEV